MQKPTWPEVKEMKSGLKKMESGLKEMRIFLEILGNPQNKLPPIFHIAGTNGKGSVSSFLKYILEDGGYKVHRYTSPHLIEFNERIEIAGQPISAEYLNELSEECRNIAEKYKINVTFFEGITIMAFLAFARNQADALILEVGMGGRLDSTNIIRYSLVSIITSISYDHTQYLGNTIRKIAIEKAGIVKDDSPVVLGKQCSEVLKVLRKITNPLYEYGKSWNIRENNAKNGLIFLNSNKVLNLPLPGLEGEHQFINAGIAIESLLVQNKIKISNENIKNGVKNAQWRARLQNLRNTKLHKLIPEAYELWLDAAHNEDGMRVLNDWIYKKNSEKYKPAIIIIGMLAEKDIKRCIDQLQQKFEIIVSVDIEGEKCCPATEFQKKLEAKGLNSVSKPNVKSALEYINVVYSKKYKDLRVVICGSLYLAGAVLKECRE